MENEAPISSSSIIEEDAEEEPPAVRRGSIQVTVKLSPKGEEKAQDGEGEEADPSNGPTGEGEGPEALGGDQAGEAAGGLEAGEKHPPLTAKVHTSFSSEELERYGHHADKPSTAQASRARMREAHRAGASAAAEIHQRAHQRSAHDPPLGGFRPLPVLSTLKSVKGSRRGRRGGSSIEEGPTPKDLLQMRQAATMVNNELSYQFRGSVMGWKLSPIKNQQRRRTPAPSHLGARPSTSMSMSYAEHSLDQSSVSHEASLASEHSFFAGLQGSSMADWNRQMMAKQQLLHAKIRSKSALGQVMASPPGSSRGETPSGRGGRGESRMPEVPRFAQGAGAASVTQERKPLPDVEAEPPGSRTPLGAIGSWEMPKLEDGGEGGGMGGTEMYLWYVKSKTQASHPTTPPRASRQNSRSGHRESGGGGMGFSLSRGGMGYGL